MFTQKQLAMSTLPLAIVILFFSSLSFTLVRSHGGQTITTRLIHRDSQFSPLYNVVETVADRARRATESSLARYEYLQSSSLSSDDDKDKLQPEGVQAGMVLATHHNIFYVKFSIGEPPVPQLAVMDTGSSLMWVKCLPCRPCWPNSGVTFFDPTKSKTYSPRPCTTYCTKCTGWFSHKQCMYTQSYLGGHYSEGVLATEQLTFLFPGSRGTTVALPNVQFGCCSLLTGTEHQDQNFNGLLSLGAGPNSLVEQLGSKFSYCVGSVSDRSYPYNRLSIGANAYLTGDATGVAVKEGLYYVFIQGITLGGQVLNIRKEALTTMSYKKGVIMDTGAELSFLYAEVFEVLKAAVVKLAVPVLKQVPAPVPYELCYRGSTDKEARGFPAMALQFARGAELTVDNFGMFKQVTNNVFCLAVLRSATTSIIGMMAQQGYNVGYDLRRRELYLQSMDCQVLWKGD